MSSEIIIEIESLYKNMVLFCHKECMLTHHGTLTMKSQPSYCPSGFSPPPKLIIISSKQRLNLQKH